MPRPSAPVLGLDTASLYYRSYYALPSSMTAPDGLPHQAIRGLLTTVTRLIEAYRPRAVVAAWDDDWRPSWRVDLVPSYKAHRVAEASTAPGARSDAVAEETPEDLSPQVDAIAEILDAMGIPRWGVPGYEADDVLGTVAQRPEPTIVVTGDRDLVQLIDDHTSVLLTVNGGMEKWPLVDTADAIQRFGVPPSAYPDMAVLRGDPSDGLPGVPGIGAKTAVTLIEAFGDLEGVIEAASAHPPVRPMTARLAERITHEAAAVRRALTVTKVVRDLPLPAAIPSWQGVAEGHALAALAGRWGVERQVSALITELDGMRQMLAE